MTSKESDVSEGVEQARDAERIETEMVQFLAADCVAMRKAGTALAEAALSVIREYDGLHRLSLAVAEWAKSIADEGGRGERYEAAGIVTDLGSEWPAVAAHVRRCAAATLSPLPSPGVERLRADVLEEAVKVVHATAQCWGCDDLDVVLAIDEAIRALSALPLLEDRREEAGR